MVNRSWRLLLVLILFFAPAVDQMPAAGPSPRFEPQGVDRPRLVVVLVLDQFIPDYLVRFRGYFTGGLKTLLDHGAVFLNAEYGHAFTQTAAGHTVVATGRHPAKSGIVANSWIDYESGKSFYSYGDESVHGVGAEGVAGASPANLKTTTLADWLKSQDPASKVIALSRKDRGAIPLAGKHGDLALWFHSSSGRFVTSTYYASQIPVWVKAFEARRPTASFYRKWTKLLDEEAYFASREDFFPAEGDSFKAVFPHLLVAPAPGGSFAQIVTSPFSDEQLLELAEAAVLGADLGRDSHTDLLAIGLSATDAIGHRYGPLSQEIQDHVLRIDRALGRYLAFLDEEVGLGNVVIVLTSDHGVLPLPEELQRRGIPARRVSRREVNASLADISQKLASRLGISGNFLRATNVGIWIDKSQITGSGVPGDTVAALVARELRTLPFVETAFTRRLVVDPGSNGEPFQDLFRNNFDPERTADVFVVFKKYALITNGRTGTSHGSPHLYDRRVPVLLYGRGIKAGQYSDRIGVVDVAPTLARLMGLEVPRDVDGKLIEKAMSQAATE